MAIESIPGAPLDIKPAAKHGQQLREQRFKSCIEWRFEN
jgi:hypothetical protein